mmetsp:Transcript_7959/g.16864  ORF Transcript_7959/g.16864 Transcript_7959/m.16864 type:complete len:377 (-) Transcript_7959:117-1247(-)|eukprot:CAMPEP_0183293070 /NCGR_PEP_ID=MMETSP0160_2-20130417/1902_1 /TAXON_ID=2839 ORGANISM="Odontella Sinensis, Strain Grunow 1884" /NCGR_SAMPLE_ID=MMETSP0160_2 /ASSEMBLY_ACC=CAM_ASM_000250 /LENGTH=376 /DNA_ID=CAMNT_0025454127 /DNA_START=63 /DNA_END=1193 /DNA_ORIENTATION=+
MTRFARSLALFLALMPNAVESFVSQLVSHRITPSSLKAVVHEEDDQKRENGMTAREARIVAPASAALATVSLGRKAAIALDGTGSFDSSVKEYFPGALPNSQSSSRVLATLKKRGYTLDSSLFGASICSDEINSHAGSLCAQLQKGLTNNQGGMFNLGGLGGLPFVGKSGFGAFFSHCPVDGKIVILFGPHVGVSQSGVVGKVERVGMTKPSTACGAGIGAYKAILAARANPNAEIPPSDGTMDNQEEWIVSQLNSKLTADDIGSGMIGSGFIGNSKMATVTYKTYDLVWDLLQTGLDISVTKPEFWEKVSEVTLLGGIIINQGHFQSAMKAKMEDYFQPFVFQSWRAQPLENALVKEDLFQSTFEMKNPKRELGL